MHDLWVVVWVCHKCLSYYGSSSAPNLAETPQPGKHSKPTGLTRAICPNPDCARQGIERKPHNINLRIGEAS